jgi:hypothetical protein
MPKKPEWKSAYSETEQMTTRSKKDTQLIEIAKSLIKPIQAWAPIGIAAIFLIAMAAWMWRTSPSKELPDELLGEWHTVNPIYADRTFELDQICITFTTGEGTISVGFIKDVKEIPDGNRTLYTVSYTVDGVPNEVSFFYDPNNGKNLWFKNQEKVVWKKDQGS